MRTGSVYGLVDPRTNKIRYVGSSFHLAVRYANHRADNGAASAGLRAWRKELRAGKLEPGLVVLEVVPARRLAAAERRWWRKLNRSGDLLNKLKPDRQKKSRRASGTEEARIVWKLLDHGMSMVSIAVKGGVSITTVYRWRRGESVRVNENVLRPLRSLMRKLDEVEAAS